MAEPKRLADRNGKRLRGHALSRLDVCGPGIGNREGAGRPSPPLKTSHDVAALILKYPRTFSALERGLGLFIAERSRAFVVSLGGARILWSPAPALRKRAHALQCAGMVLRGGLLEQAACGDIVLRAADAVCQHQSEL